MVKLNLTLDLINNDFLLILNYTYRFSFVVKNYPGLRKRKIEIAVISDVHLGTYGCRADELLAYLNSIKPKKLILNGDIIDIWQFNKRFFPSSHLKVLKKIISLASNGTEVVYITGNHDEMLRKFVDMQVGNFHLANKLLLEIDGKKAWFFHGDVFDMSIQHSKWLAKLGGYGYNLLLKINRMVNWVLQKLGREKFSLATRIKSGVKGAAKYIDNFERTATDLAIENGYDYVICGHIHKPKKEICENKNGKCMYLNSGDWVENLTALEYSFKRWKIYQYSQDKLSAFYADEELKEMDMNELISSIIELKAKNKPAKEKDGESVED